MKKILITSTVIIIVFTQIGILLPLTTRAAVPVLETNPALLTALGVTSGATSSNLVQTLLEWAWKFTRAQIKKQLLDVLVDQTVAWIQGTDGKPQFVVDWQGFLENAGKEAIGELVQESGAGFLCSPFSLSVRIGLFPIQRFSKIDERAKCTLDTIVGNIENFYDDFREGGWVAYQTMLEPQNNIFSASLMLQLEERDRAAKKALAKVNEALSGGGFLATKDCKKDSAGRDIPSTCRVTTPGRLLADQASKAIGSGIDYILSAEEIGDYAAAITDALLNRIIAEGTKGLLGANAPSIPDTVYVDASQLGGSCANFPPETQQACVNATQQFGDNFEFTQNRLVEQINNALQPLGAAVDKYDQSIALLNSYIADLESLMSQFGGLTTCSNRPNGQSNPITPEALEQIKTDLGALVEEEQALLSNITDTKNDAQNNKINPLLAAGQELAGLIESQTSEITRIYNSVSGLIDPIAAVNQREAAFGQFEEIQARKAAKIKEFQDKYQQCVAPTNN